MLRIAKTEARRRFSEVVTLAAHKGERVKITHYGRTLAVIVPAADLDVLERHEQEARDQMSGGHLRADDPGR
jgi:prevent-host-death family protein